MQTSDLTPSWLGLVVGWIHPSTLPGGARRWGGKVKSRRTAGHLVCVAEAVCFTEIHHSVGHAVDTLEDGRGCVSFQGGAQFASGADLGGFFVCVLKQADQFVPCLGDGIALVGQAERRQLLEQPILVADQI